MTKAPPSYGWYGKVPCVGDFVRAGLSPAFVSAWDAWMQALLTEGKEALGDRWQDCYLGAPIWRFALSAGSCGPLAAAGVMMPSVDRVGRQFPFCLAVEMDAPAWVAYRSIEPALAALEEAALAMLDDAPLTVLENTLAQLPPPRAPARRLATRQGLAITALLDDTPEDALAEIATAEPSTIWIASAGDPMRMLLAQRMPAGAEGATALFDLHAPLWTLPE